jgi:hypothetical protein
MSNPTYISIEDNNLYSIYDGYLFKYIDATHVETMFIKDVYLTSSENIYLMNDNHNTSVHHIDQLTFNFKGIRTLMDAFKHVLLCRRSEAIVKVG